MIDGVLRRLVNGYERRVLGRKPVPFGWAARLTHFEHVASEREWQQLMYYMEMMSRVRGVPGDVVEFGVAGGASYLAFGRCLRVLERGFALVRSLDGGPLRRAAAVEAGQGLDIEFADGRVRAAAEGAPALSPVAPPRPRRRRRPGPEEGQGSLF